MAGNIKGIFDALKMVGGVIAESIDMGNYRITLIIEKKVDNSNSGIVVEHIYIDRPLNANQLKDISNRIKGEMNRPY